MQKVMIGKGIVGVALFFSLIMNDYTLLYKITGVVALISLAWSSAKS